MRALYFCPLSGVILVTRLACLAPYDNAAMTETAAPLKKIAEGREAEMFAWGEGRVLRLYRPEITYTTAAHQARLWTSRRPAVSQFPRSTV